MATRPARALFFLRVCCLVAATSLAHGQDTADQHSNQGTTLFGKGDLDGAILQYREAVRLNPNSAQLRYQLGVAVLRRGDHYRKEERIDDAKKEYAEAARHLSESLRLNPNSVEAHLALSEAFFGQDDFDGYRRHLHEAAILKPSDASLQSSLGFAHLFFAGGDLNQAVAAYREAIRLAPSADSYRALGDALHRQGKGQEAIEAYREAIRLEPRNALTHLKLAETLLEQGATDEASTHYEQAVRIDPSWGDRLRTDAVVLFAQEKYAECSKLVEVLQRLGYKLDPDFTRQLREKAAARTK